MLCLLDGTASLCYQTLACWKFDHNSGWSIHWNLWQRSWSLHFSNCEFNTTCFCNYWPCLATKDYWQKNNVSFLYQYAFYYQHWLRNSHDGVLIYSIFDDYGHLHDDLRWLVYLAYLVLSFRGNSCKWDNNSQYRALDCSGSLNLDSSTHCWKDAQQ